MILTRWQATKCRPPHAPLLLCPPWPSRDAWQPSAQWLATFLDFPRGIPKADCYRRVFAQIEPEALARCFQRWIAEIVQDTGGQVIPTFATLGHFWSSDSASPLAGSNAHSTPAPTHGYSAVSHPNPLLVLIPAISISSFMALT